MKYEMYDQSLSKHNDERLSSVRVPRRSAVHRCMFIIWVDFCDAVLFVQKLSNKDDVGLQPHAPWWSFC